MEIQNNIQHSSQYNILIEQIGSLLQQGRKHVASAVNNILVQTYWNIGKYIVEFEQGGAIKAEYGDELLLRLSKDLTQAYGKGFSRSNLFNIRLFYIKFSKIQTLSGQFGETLSRQLNWSHYVEILKADSNLEISFYVQQCEKENWSVRELKRQMNSLLFHRLALSKDKESVLKLAEKGAEIQKPEDIVKESFVLEFLGIPQQEQYLEGELEERLIKNLEAFLLELGKGFAFVKRQYRVPVNNRNFSVDLVFYHIILKCYVLIDLKRGEIEHGDIGQMNFYLNYFRKEVNIETDNEPIGIVLGAYKDNIMVEYAMDNINNQLFVSKYQLYLPNKEDLRNIINRQLKDEDI
ncbi:hypothetical protein AGMMS4956_17220 [Bacteroidia bacterium]|nr:hypothetical protein AGMMS4956_17220 [Bacteroidia bacterium]